MQSVKGWICKETLKETIDKIKWENAQDGKRAFMYGVIGVKPDSKNLFDCYMTTSLSDEDKKLGFTPVTVFTFRTIERHREYMKRKKLAKAGIEVNYDKVLSFVKTTHVKGTFNKKALNNLIKNTNWGKPSTVDGKHYVYFDGVIGHSPDDQNFDCFLNIALPKHQWGTDAAIVKFLRFRTLERFKETIEQYTGHKKERDGTFNDNKIEDLTKRIPRKADTDDDSIF